VDGCGVALEIRASLRPRNGHGVIPLGENPGQRDLRRRGGLPHGKGLEPPYERKVSVEVVALEARQAPAQVVVRKGGHAGDTTGEKPTAERAEGNQRDAKLPADRNDAGFRVAPPEGILALERTDRVDPVRAANGGRGGFRESEIADLAGLDQTGHAPDRILNRRPRVDAVEID